MPAEVTEAVLAVSEPVAEYSHVGREIRHIAFITIGFVVLQVCLWLAFSNTGFEDQLIRMIKI